MRIEYRSVCRLLLVLVTLAGPGLRETAAEERLSKNEARAVNAAVTAQLESQGLVGVAIGVLRDNEVVYVQGYGLADRERKVPVTPATVFNWASNSKPVIAVAAMQLVEKGMLDLDKDIRTYVPEFPDKGVTITTRHLLCHQSGFPHYLNGRIVSRVERSLSVKEQRDPIQVLPRFSHSPLIAKPQEQYSYSSYAYVILSAVVQRAGKSPLADQLKTRITERLEMASFQLDLPLDRQRNWAVSYQKSLFGGLQVVPEEAHYWKHGAGGYKSNVRDFARWARALLNRELVTASIERQMWEPQSTRDGKVTDYALGFGVDGQGDSLRVSHNGAQRETRTRLVLYPNRDHGVVVMCNTANADVGKISTAIYQALAAQRPKALER